MIEEPTLFDTAPTLLSDTAWTPKDAGETEIEAAAVAARGTRGVKQQALRLYGIAGAHGLTDDDVAALLDEHHPRPDGFPHNPSKIASRRKELEENRYPTGEHGPALVEPTDDQRRTRRGVHAVVYRITDAGREALAALRSAA